jgi:hypothetical protein
MSDERGRWSRWVAFWSEREPGEPMAILRILVGLVAAWTAFSPIVHGAVPLFVDITWGGLAPVGAGPTWMDLLTGATPSAVHASLIAATLSGLATAAGLGGRWTPLLTGQLMLLMFTFHPGTGGGHDRVITNACWLLFLGDPARTLSLDCRLRTGRWTDDTPVLAMPRRLVVWQLVYMYTLTGLQKQGDAWGAYSGWRAVYDTLLLPSWNRVDLRQVLGQTFFLTQVGTVVAWWWESTWPLLLVQGWYRLHPESTGRLASLSRAWDLRPLFIALGVITHVTLFIFCDLGPFSAITMSLYIALYDGHAVRAAVRRWWPGMYASDPVLETATNVV